MPYHEGQEWAILSWNDFYVFERKWSKKIIKMVPASIDFDVHTKPTTLLFAGRGAHIPKKSKKISVY